MEAGGATFSGITETRVIALKNTVALLVIEVHAKRGNSLLRAPHRYAYAFNGMPLTKKTQFVTCTVLIILMLKFIYYKPK